MANTLTPILFAAFFWWLSTGLILWFIGRTPPTFKWTAGAASLIAIGATAGLIALRSDTSVASAYLGFTFGVLLWAWHEVMFLLGYIGGSRKGPCPPNLSIMSRFVASTQVIIHHELLIAAHAVLITALSWGAENQFGALTFYLLWAMRLSTKLVVFFGAPNISDHFLPPHLQYLSTYFHKKPNNVFFPVAFAASVVITGALAYGAYVSPAGGFASVGFLLLASLASLAVIEHLALVLPLPDAALWAWATRRPENAPGRAPIAAELKNQ